MGAQVPSGVCGRGYRGNRNVPISRGEGKQPPFWSTTSVLLGECGIEQWLPGTEITDRSNANACMGLSTLSLSKDAVFQPLRLGRSLPSQPLRFDNRSRSHLRT